jgi:Peptidase A4 family
VKCKTLVAVVPALLAALALAPAASAPAASAPAASAPAGTRPAAAQVFAPFADYHGGQNWTGYVAVAGRNVKLRYVATSFRIPTVTCTSSNSKASFWTGLDGYGNHTVEQVGISTDCRDGEPFYQAWLELFPRPTDYIFQVFPGDSIFMSVFHNFGNNRYYLTLEDTTIHRSFVNLSSPCPPKSTCESSTAEVILEADNGGNLSKFTKATFVNSQVTSRNGTRGAFRNTGLWSLAEPLMTGSNGNPLASVSATSHNGADFSFTYRQR